MVMTMRCLHPLKSSWTQAALYRQIRRLFASSNFSIVHPGVVTPTRPVPDHIVKPPYVATGGVPDSISSEIEVKTVAQIDGVRNACRLARQVLNMAVSKVKVGMTTDEIDQTVHEECIAHNAYPSPLLYKGFPKSVCTSVNNVVCHGIPDNRPLESGDILNIDVTVYHHGYHGDTSETIAVGDVDRDGRFLLHVGQQCLDNAILHCKPGVKFSEIGIVVCEHANSQGFSVVPQINGHGIGSYFHGPPDIYHIPYEYHQDRRSLETMQPGMTFTIEPVISDGSGDIKLLDDKWTIVSTDDSRSCQFEHTVLITSTGVEVLTRFYHDDYGEL